MSKNLSLPEAAHLQIGDLLVYDPSHSENPPHNIYPTVFPSQVRVVDVLYYGYRFNLKIDTSFLGSKRTLGMSGSNTPDLDAITSVAVEIDQGKYGMKTVWAGYFRKQEIKKEA